MGNNHMFYSHYYIIIKFWLFECDTRVRMMLLGRRIVTVQKYSNNTSTCPIFMSHFSWYMKTESKWNFHAFRKSVLHACYVEVFKLNSFAYQVDVIRNVCCHNFIDIDSVASLDSFNIFFLWK